MLIRMAQCPAFEPSTMLSKESTTSTNTPVDIVTTASSQSPIPAATTTPLAAERELPVKPDIQPQQLAHKEQEEQQREESSKKSLSGLGAKQSLHAARPVSEIFTQKQMPLNGKSFQSPEAEAIDKWFEDLSHYEQTLEEMAAVSLDHVFKEELSTVESWLSVLSEAECTAALYSLLQHSSQVQIRFFITVLQQLAKKDPVGVLLSPSVDDKDSAQKQLHGAMAKAEKDVSQRLLNVLPIQPPTSTSPLDRSTVGRRLYDRHSVTIGESEEYTRLFRKDNKRNSTDILSLGTSHLSDTLHPNATTGPGASNSESSNLSNNNTHINNNSVQIAPVNGVGKLSGVSGNRPIGSGSSVFSESGARAKLTQPTATLIGSNSGLTSTSTSNRVSAPGLFANRPKSVCEGDTSSIFSSNWNFASLGGSPLTYGSEQSAGSTLGAGSPGHIGDRASFGRPKSVGGAEWMLTGTSNTNTNINNSRSQPGADGLRKSWTPLLISPNMGGFHSGTNGTGHNFAGSSSGYSGSSLAVERPKSVTEADLAKLNVSQWPLGGGVPSSSANTSTTTVVNNSHHTNANLSGVGSRSALEDAMKPNRRRTLFRPSAIISNVPVTVLEGDEKLLSASANTSSINIVSSLFDEPEESNVASLPTRSSAITGSFQYSSPAFSQQQQQVQQFYSQQPQQALSQQLSSLSLKHAQQQPSQPLYYQQQASSPRTQSPMTSPLPSPITSGFRSRPTSRPTSPGPTAHHNYSSVRNVWNANGSHGYGHHHAQHHHHNGYNSYNNSSSNHYHHHGGGGGGMMGHHGYPMDYHQKRHLSPPDMHSRGTSVLDDDYMSDTSDMSSLGMHSLGRGSMGKDKKQYEAVDFDLLQDTPAWLRSLRLHKYNGIFEGMNWREIVNLSDGDLINKGVAALGARRKMLKVFEQVRKEMLLQGMTI
ncbi:hypothetical protein BG004_007623 [Podila humilis]|nr:hypothetical protein BG004_007623 [Podila humilis]